MALFKPKTWFKKKETTQQTYDLTPTTITGGKETGGIVTGGKTDVVTPTKAVQTYVSSGGGGGSSSSSSSTPYPLPTTQANLPPIINTNQPTPNQVAMDVPKSYETAQQRAGIVATTTGIATNFWNKITQRETRDDLIKNQQVNLQTGQRTRPFDPSGQGTPVTYTQAYSNKEIVTMAKNEQISDTAAINELGRRENEKYGKQYNFLIESAARNLQTNARQSLNNEVQNQTNEIKNIKDQLQEKVNNGSISLTDAQKQLQNEIDLRNRILSAKTNEVNSQIDQKLQGVAQNFVEGQGKTLEARSNIYLTKVSDKIKLSKTLTRLPLYVAAGAGTGLALTAVAATSAVAGAVVNVAGVGMAGYTAFQTGKYIGTSYKQGTLTASTIGNVFIPLIAFGVGAKIGSLVASPKVNEPVLRRAIERANVETKVERGISNEAQIRKLQISDRLKLDLQENYLNKGYSIKEISVKIKGANAMDSKIINKGIPNQNIKFIEVTGSNGKIINRFAVGKISVGRGLVSYKEDVLSGGTGQINPKTGKGFMESYTETGKGNKLLSAEKNLNVFETKSGQFNTPEGTFKILTSKGKTFKGGKVTSVKNKPITFEDLQAVANSEYKRIHSSTSKNFEVQKLNRLNLNFKDGDLMNLDKTYSIISGKGTAIKTPDPIPFDKTPSRVIKDFFSTQDSNFLNLKNSKGSNNINLKSFGGSNINLQKIKIKPFDLISSDNIATITKSSIQRAITSPNLNFNLNVLSASTLAPLINLKDLNKNLNKPVLNFSLDQNKFNNLLKNNQIQYDKILSRQAVIPKQNIQLKQLQQFPALKNPPFQMNFPPITPTIIPKPTTFPMLPIFPMPSGFKKLKKLKKKPFKFKSGYSASLISAAVQARPLKVSRKQFENLKKKTYSGFEVRPVLQIVNDKEIERLQNQIKKAKSQSSQKVNFDFSSRGSSSKGVVF